MSDFFFVIQRDVQQHYLILRYSIMKNIDKGIGMFEMNLGTYSKIVSSQVSKIRLVVQIFY